MEFTTNNGHVFEVYQNDAFHFTNSSKAKIDYPNFPFLVSLALLSNKKFPYPTLMHDATTKLPKTKPFVLVLYKYFQDPVAGWLRLRY
jgi:hypothetical protein